MTIPYFDHIYYNDCLDDQNGLPYLASQVENGILPKIDIGFTDPPFNIDLQNNPNGGRKFHQTKKKDQQYYDDNLSPEDYEQWCRTWFGLLRKICRTVIIYCGNDNLAMWYRIQEPLDQIIYFTPFNTIITPTAWAGRFRPLLIYSDHYNDFLGRNDTYKLKSNVIVSEETGKKKSKYKHPCPMPYELVHSVLFDLKPKSVIDPFLGSGTIAEA